MPPRSALAGLPRRIGLATWVKRTMHCGVRNGAIAPTIKIILDTIGLRLVLAPCFKPCASVAGVVICLQQVCRVCRPPPAVALACAFLCVCVIHLPPSYSFSILCLLVSPSLFCLPVYHIFFKVDENGVITESKFKTFGCGSAIASSSVATEWLKGRSVDESLKIKNTDIAGHLKLPPVKLHCRQEEQFCCVCFMFSFL